jgi:hypothetical protein
MVTYLTSCPKLIGLMVENHNNNNNIQLHTLCRANYEYIINSLNIFVFNNMVVRIIMFGTMLY